MGVSPLDPLLRLPLQHYCPLRIVYQASKTKEEDLQSQCQSESSVKGAKRIKERSIQTVLYKVAMWRSLYLGYLDSQGIYKQQNLEEAARTVDISKKTLDDYLLQIRLGKKYGFDFQGSINQKIGALRSFVKKAREEEKTVNLGSVKRCNFKDIDLDLGQFLKNIKGSSLECF